MYIFNTYTYIFGTYTAYSLFPAGAISDKKLFLLR